MFCDFLKQCSTLCRCTTNAVIIHWLWFSSSEGTPWLIGQNLVLGVGFLALKLCFQYILRRSKKNVSKAVSELLYAICLLCFIIHMNQFEALGRSLI